MGQTKELVNAYFPLIAAVIIISLLHVHAVKGWGLHLSLVILVASELGLMFKQRENGKDSDLVEALKLGPPFRGRDEALFLAYTPRIALEIFASLTMPRHGNLALTVLFVTLFIQNMTLLLNGGEIVTGEIEAVTPPVTERHDTS